MKYPVYQIGRRQIVIGVIVMPIASNAAVGCAAMANTHFVDTFIGIGSSTTAGASFIVTLGWSNIGIGAARYRRIVSPVPAEAAWTSRGSATSRDGYLYCLEPGSVIEVDQFGAIGDDKTDDYNAIKAAIAFWKMVGGTLGFSPNRRYFVGTWSGETNQIFTVDHLRDAVIDGRGATIRSHSAAQRCQTFLFTLRDFRNVTIRSLRATDSGTDINIEWRGLYFVSPDANLGECENLLLDGVIVYDAVAFLYAAGTLPQRIKGIRIVRSSAIRCYYGMVFAENGDDVQAELTTISCRRSYFAYGVNNHKINLKINHGGKTVGADACCLIKRYVFDTVSVSLVLAFSGSVTQFNNLVKLEHQPEPPTKAGQIRNILVALNLRQVSAGLDHVTGIGFSSYANTRLETGQTTNIWDAITISGDLDLVKHPITAYSRPSSAVRIYLEGSAAKIKPTLPYGYALVRRSQPTD